LRRCCKAADQHQQQGAEYRPLVAEPLPDGAARQGQRDARREIQADQDSDVGQSNAEVAAEQGCYGGDALTPSSPETFSRNFSAALSFWCPILV